MKKTLRTLIVDDEQPARALLRRLLREFDFIELLDDCRTGKAAIAAIRDAKPDLVLLDIQLPDMTGLDIVRKIGPERMPPVVFVTAYDDYAVPAFEVHAVDYLLKPFRNDRLELALTRARHRSAMSHAERNRRLTKLMADWQHDRPTETSAESDFVQQVLVREGRSRLVVAVGDVRYFEAEDHYVRVHTRIGKSHLINQALGELEQQLDPTRFVRIHRGTIVNLQKVVRIEAARFGAYHVILDNQVKLSVARSRRETLRRLLPAAGKNR